MKIKNCGLIIILMMLGSALQAQQWEVLERTTNNLVPVLGKELNNDTLRLISGKSYEISLPDLFDQQTGLIQKKLYVQNLSYANYLDLEVSHEQNIIDLIDTLYLAKVKFQQVDRTHADGIAYPAKIVVRNKDGKREKELVILPQEMTPSPSRQ